MNPLLRARNRAARPALAATIALGFLVLSAGCAEGPTGPNEGLVMSPLFHHDPGHGGGPSDGDDAGPTIIVRITTSIAGSGLYGDAANSYDGRFASDGGLRVGADCPEQMVLDLTGQSDAFAWPVETPTDAECLKKRPGAFARITLPEFNFGDVAEGDILGEDPTIAAGETNLCCVLNYYFGDNVVWKGGIRVVGVEEPDASTKIVRLSTIPDLSNDDLSDDDDLSGDAELWDRDKGTTFFLAGVTAHLELEVTIASGS